VRFLLFGRDEDFDIDAAWWPLWSSEVHEAKNASAAIAAIRRRLLDGGEEQYVELAAVPIHKFTIKQAAEPGEDTGADPEKVA